jgi:PAS domain S-box-containing protein
MAMSLHSKPFLPRQVLEDDAEDLYENAPCAYLSTLPDGTIIKVNGTFLEWTGYARELITGKKSFQDLLPLAGRVFYDTHFGPLLLMQGFAKELAFEVICEGGHRIPVLLNSKLKRDENGQPLVIRTSLIDARGRRAYEEELRLARQKAENAEALLKKLMEELEDRVIERTRERDQMQDRLRQSQKMEAIGKLTGGIAHDFNNILQVIGGNLELLKLDPAAGMQADHRLDTAFTAVSRGALLASQLLSFARKQPLQPKPIHLGRILRNMDSLLRRALGEEIDIETIVGGGLWNALVDPNQLENAILNLAINARDAMGGQGKLTLELGNAMLDEFYALKHGDIAPGQYVMLAVSDTGTGMSAEIMERAFEPFFTTKPDGEGTGLGLSMVYGFVRQSGGHVKIYSEPGEGTTFRIYFPRVLEQEIDIPDVRSLPVVGGKETILVVEDDPAVQATVVEMLTGLGYQVLRAKDGQSAVTILESGASIDLLFTDVVMPGPVRSPDLARHAKALLPEIEVLFTSGYTQNAIVHGGRLDPGVELISKPYRREDLARRIRHLMANREQASYARKILQESRDDSRSAASVTAPASFAASTQPNLQILIVEDNEDSREVLCEVLKTIGYQALSTDSAESALDLLSGKRFDVLLTDVRLPGMKGTELAARAIALYPGIKVVFTTGYGVIETQDFRSWSLPKPFDIRRVKELLDGFSDGS